eukprot:GILK01003522.1.p1 GENE.GILK01003522.1~~GILK01003522.1.p1  ORF type:complete len:248 (+),score=13.56 GILK01003522.1:123-866(+)
MTLQLQHPHQTSLPVPNSSPIPRPVAPIHDEVERYVSRLLQEHSESSWTVLKTEKSKRLTYELSRKPIPGFENVMFRVKFYLPGIMPEWVYDTILDGPGQKTWNPLVKDVEVLYEENGWSYRVTDFKAPPGIADREIVERRATKYDHVSSTRYIIYTSQGTEHIQATRPVRKRYVRGSTFLTGYIISPLEHEPQYAGQSGACVTFLTHGSPGGSIPVILLNAFGGRAAVDFCNALRKEVIHRYVPGN